MQLILHSNQDAWNLIVFDILATSQIIDDADILSQMNMISLNGRKKELSDEVSMTVYDCDVLLKFLTQNRDNSNRQLMIAILCSKKELNSLYERETQEKIKLICADNECPIDLELFSSLKKSFLKKIITLPSRVFNTLTRGNL